jgi:hypothetical protein
LFKAAGFCARNAAPIRSAKYQLNPHDPVFFGKDYRAGFIEFRQQALWIIDWHNGQSR